MIFYVGDVWKPKLTITDTETGSKVDPTTVTATITKPPNEATETVSVTKVETGVYTVSVPLTAAGQWKVVVTGTGEHQAAAPETITVQAP